jgi:hypothetical protein
LKSAVNKGLLQLESSIDPATKYGEFPPLPRTTTRVTPGAEPNFGGTNAEQNWIPAFAGTGLVEMVCHI